MLGRSPISSTPISGFTSGVVLTLGFGETLQVVDNTSKVVSTNLDQTIGISEAYNFAASFNRGFAEGVSVSSNWENTTTYNRTFGESVLFTEATNKQISIACGEAITLIDAGNTAANFVLGVAESLSIVSAQTSEVIYRVLVGETLQVTDDVAKQMGFVCGEIISFIEALNNVSSFIRGFEEEVTVDSSLTTSTTYNRNFSDSFTMTEARTSGIFLNTPESLKITEAQSRVTSFIRGFLDTIGVSESLSKDISLTPNEFVHFVDAFIQNARAVFSEMNINIDELSLESFTSLLSGESTPAGFSKFSTMVDGDYEYQRALIKVVLTSLEQSQARLKNLDIIVDVPDINDGGTTIVPVGGTTVYFSRQFTSKPAVVAHLKAGVVIGVPKVVLVELDHFVIDIISMTGESVGGTVSWEAEGY